MFEIKMDIENIKYLFITTDKAIFYEANVSSIKRVGLYVEEASYYYDVEPFNLSWRTNELFYRSSLVIEDGEILKNRYYGIIKKITYFFKTESEYCKYKLKL